MNAIQKIDTIPVCDVSVFLIVSFSEQMFQFCCSPLYQFKKKFVFLCLSTSSSQRLFLKYSSRNFSFSLFMVKPVICAWYEVRVEVHFICRWIFSFPVPYFPHWIALVHLLKVSRAFMCRSSSGLFILFCRDARTHCLD